MGHYQGHHAAEICLGERGNRAWIDSMFVERIRADLQLDTGLAELGQFPRQIIRPLQAGDRRPIDDDPQLRLGPLLGQILQIGEDVGPVLDFGGMKDNFEIRRDRGDGGWRPCWACAAAS
jgi:hypothetical protein